MNIAKILCAFFWVYLTCACTNDNSIRSKIETENKNNCECPLEKNLTEEAGKKEQEQSRAFKADAKLSADIPYLKKFIQTQIESSALYLDEMISSEAIYWEVLNGNPEIAQGANLFRNVTCALIQIACEDTSLSQKELSSKKEQFIREYNEKIEKIWKESRLEIDKDGRKLSPSIIKIDNSKKSTTIKTTSNENYFNFNAMNFSQIAILAVGDKSHKDFALTLNNWLESNNYSSTVNLFNLNFWGTFRSRLLNRDFEVFTENNLDQLTNCVCIFDQSTRLKESILAEEEFVTVIFNGNLKLYDLKNNAMESRIIDVRGAGITIARAMENVEEKLYAEFANLEVKFSRCR